jgi:hypothetical protein
LGKNNDVIKPSATQDFESIKKVDPTLAQADFGDFDESQDGKIARKE